MRRREFLGALSAATAWPLAARAQQPERMRRIGVLMGYAEDDPETKLRLADFRERLAKRGWLEGRNVHITYRFRPGSAVNVEQFQALAKELVAQQFDLILAHTTAVAAALQRETSSIPIVFVNVSDPIGSGFIESLAHPGGNLTGVMHIEASIVGKWLAMLKEIAPRLARAALMANRKTTAYEYFLQSAEAMAPSLGIEVVPSHIETAADIERVMEFIARTPNGGLMLPPDSTTLAQRELIIARAAGHRLPAVYSLGAFVQAGGLMSYGTDQGELFRLAASYVDRILRGDKPGDLPVQAPTKFETAINLKTAKALGVTVPSGLLVAADEVIE